MYYFHNNFIWACFTDLYINQYWGTVSIMYIYNVKYFCFEYVKDTGVKNRK